LLKKVPAGWGNLKTITTAGFQAPETVSSAEGP
jgi:hypothetical protein